MCNLDSISEDLYTVLQLDQNLCNLPEATILCSVIRVRIVCSGCGWMIFKVFSNLANSMILTPVHIH